MIKKTNTFECIREATDIKSNGTWEKVSFSQYESGSYAVFEATLTTTEPHDRWIGKWSRNGYMSTPAVGNNIHRYVTAPDSFE